MKINIAENIRKYRKERGLTQERLAEIFGVSVGAVSKWEAGASVPELSVILEMAGFFETSVDVLLGYGIISGSMKDAIDHIKQLRNAKKFDEASAEAEKSLERYPNCFDMAFACAITYCMKGVELKSEKAYRRALALFERSLELIGQNTDKHISEWSIKNRIAEVYISLGQTEKGVEHLKENNVDGLNNTQIGYVLAAEHKSPDEALGYLSDAMLDTVAAQLRLCSGYLNVYMDKKDYENALKVQLWIAGIIEGLKKPGKVTYLDRMTAQILSGCAIAEVYAKNTEDARVYVKKALEAAQRFDAAPSYNFPEMNFYYGDGSATAFDDFGGTAKEGIKKTLLTQTEHTEEFKKLWEEIENE